MTRSVQALPEPLAMDTWAAKRPHGSGRGEAARRGRAGRARSRWRWTPGRRNGRTAAAGGKPRCGTCPESEETVSSLLWSWKSYESSKTSKGETPRPHGPHSRKTPEIHIGSPKRRGARLNHPAPPRCREHQPEPEHEPRQGHRQQPGEHLRQRRPRRGGRLTRLALEGLDRQPLCRGWCIRATKPERVRSPKANPLMYHDVEKRAHGKGRLLASIVPHIPPLAAAPDRAHQPQAAHEGAGEADEAEGGQAEQGGAAFDGHDDGRADDERGDHQGHGEAVGGGVDLVAHAFEVREVDAHVHPAAARSEERR